MKAMKASSQKKAPGSSDKAPGPSALKKYGPISFAIGIAVSIVSALLWQSNASVSVFVALMGIVVGIFNINDDEVQQFLLAAITFTVSAGGLISVFTMTDLPILNSMVPAFCSYIIAFTAPAASVVAFKQIYSMAKD